LPGAPTRQPTPPRPVRSRSSCGYPPCLVMAPTSHESEPPGIPGCSYRSSSRVEGLEVGDQGVVDLAGRVSLDTAHDVLLGQPLLGAPLGIGPGAWTPAHADHHGKVQRPVGVAVTATVEPVAVGL